MTQYTASKILLVPHIVSWYYLASQGEILAYPATIVNSLGMSLASNPVGQFGWVYAGNQYCCLLDALNHPVPFSAHLHIFKSTDAGQTWNELDAVNAPDVQNGQTGVVMDYTCAVDGNTVQILWSRTHFAGGITILDGLTRCTFNLLTGTWTVPVDISSGGFGFTSNIGRKLVFQIVVRGPGDYIVIHTGTRNGNNGRVSYSPYDGTALGAEVQIPGQTVGITYIPVGAVYEPVSGRVFIEYRQGNQFFVNPVTIWVIGLDSTLIFGNATQVVASGAGHSVYPIDYLPVPIIFVQSGVRKLGIVTCEGFGSNTAVEFYSATVALNPVFSAAQQLYNANDDDQPLSTVPLAGGDPIAISLASDASRLQVCWTAHVNNGINDWFAFMSTVSQIGSGIWTVPTQFFTPIIQNDHHIAYQVYSYQAGLNIIGTIGQSESDHNPDITNNLTQFNLLTPPVAVTYPAIPGQVGQPYNNPPTPSGGVPPYTYTEVGALPPGIVFNPATGVFSGTPTYGGVYPVVVTIHDSADGTATFPIYLVIAYQFNVNTTNLGIVALGGAERQGVGNRYLDTSGAIHPPFPIRRVSQ